MTNELNPTGLFADELKVIAEAEADAKIAVEKLKEEIADRKRQISELTAEAKDLREHLSMQVRAVYEAAHGNSLMEGVIKKNLHHAITVEEKTELVYDEKAALDYAIENNLMYLVRKPSGVKKMEFKKMFKNGTLDFVDAEEVTALVVSISSKLGDMVDV